LLAINIPGQVITAMRQSHTLWQMFVLTPFSSHRGASQNEVSVVVWFSQAHRVVFQPLTLARQDFLPRLLRTEIHVAPAIAPDAAGVFARSATQSQRLIRTRYLTFITRLAAVDRLPTQIHRRNGCAGVPEFAADCGSRFSVKRSLFGVLFLR